MSKQVMSVVLPPDFDPESMTERLVSAARKQHGEDLELQSIDVEARVALFVRTVKVARLVNNEIHLPAHLATPAAGERVASMIAEQRPGHVMVEFNPTRATARIAPMSPDEQSARAAVAEVFSVKPWDVGIESRSGGGFVLTRVPSRYTASRHDERLREVAETKVPGGRPGWFVRVDGAKLVGEIVPADLPTFPPSFPYDMRDLKHAHRDRILVGYDLPDPGLDRGEPFALDFAAGAFCMLGGLPNGGKSVTLNAIIAGALASQHELVIVDTPDKAVDFLWCKEMVRPGGWGCESLEDAVAVLSLMYEEGQRRATVLKQHGATNWLGLPKDLQFRPILAIIDEYAALVIPEKEPKQLDKEHPLRVEVNERNLYRALIERMVSKITAEMRFTGLRMVVSSQVANASTGLGPGVKAKMAHRLLMGANPSKPARTQAFNDDVAVPLVPTNIRADKAAGRGVGCYESEGRTPAVFKSLFAEPAAFRKALLDLGVATTARPEPTPAEVAKFLPDDLFGDDGPPPSRFDGGGFGERDGRDAGPDRKLTGAARAGHELKQLLGDS